MLTLRALGALDVRNADGRALDGLLSQPKRSALLAYLALSAAGEFHRRDTILALFWPDLDQGRGRRALSQALSFLRRHSGEGVVVTRGGDEVGVDSTALRTDVAAFERALSAGDWDAALKEYRGDLLEGLHVAGAGPFMDWVDRKREPLRRAAAGAGWQLAAQCLAAGSLMEAEQAALRARSLAPTDESPVRSYLLALGARDRAAAIRFYETWAALLDAELGVDPSEETRAIAGDLRDGILSADPPTTTHRAVPFSGSVTVPHARKSIVVLPFDNMSPDPGNAYFADGLTEEIITALSHIRSLRVISRNSALVLRGTPKDTRTIGRELDVRYVLEGSVRKTGSQLRIAAQLIDAESDTHLWAETYHGVLEDVFSMQENLARAIVDALKVELSAPEDHDLSLRPAHNLRAYDLYLLGRHHWHRFTEDGIRKAIEFYQRAIDQDPTFALAHGGLAGAYLTLSGAGVPGLPAREGIPKAKAAAQTALAIDPTTVFGAGAMGLVHLWYDLDWQQAGDLLRRTTEAHPGSSEARQTYAFYLSLIGLHGEAMEQISLALDLDPLWPIYSSNAAEFLYFFRRFDEMPRYCERALELDPEFGWAHMVAAMADLQLGQEERAIERLEQRVDPRHPWGAQYLGYAYGKTGRSGDALGVLDRLERMTKEGFASAANEAMVHLGMGDGRRALDQLEAALDEHPPGSTTLAHLGVEPVWDPLREHDRFRKVVGRIGTP